MPAIGVSVQRRNKKGKVVGTHGMTLYNHYSGLILNDIGSRGVNHSQYRWERKWINEKTLTHWYYLQRIAKRR